MSARVLQLIAVVVAATACSGSDGGVAAGDGGSDPLAAARAACTFTSGARVQDTLGISAEARAALPIKNVIVLMKENRSFDHMLGALHDQGQPDTDAIPADFTNPDNNGADVAPAHAKTTCFVHDLGHQWPEMHLAVDQGKMDGFARIGAVAAGGDAQQALSYYDQTDLPFDYWLANTFALNDRHFPSVLSGTYPNRNFLLLGTADGVASTGEGYPDASTPTIFDALDSAGVTWGVYSDGALFSGALGWKLPHAGAHPFADFLAALDAGTLPQVVFVDGLEGLEDEHPTGDVQHGEAWTRNIYEHAVKSPLWSGLAMFWTYDEGGGFFDHVPPPDDACVARPGGTDYKFYELGVRVPFVAISPWARPHAVSHVVQDHTAITRFIETVFDLPALTARDANMTAALDLFDFSSAPPLETPPAAPEAGTGGCDLLTTDKPTYAVGDPVTLSFADAPGNDPSDRIAVFPYVAGWAAPPGPDALAWAYVGGGQTQGASPTSGSVTLDASTPGTGSWPLAAGRYVAYYLVGGGTSARASADFTVQ